MKEPALTGQPQESSIPKRPEAQKRMRWQVNLTYLTEVEQITVLFEAFQAVLSGRRILNDFEGQRDRDFGQGRFLSNLATS